MYANGVEAGIDDLEQRLIAFFFVKLCNLEVLEYGEAGSE
jgi:hypothetical protein